VHHTHTNIHTKIHSPNTNIQSPATPGDVIELKADAGRSFSLEELTTALETHKPALLFLCQVITILGWGGDG
jgi:hypothetical protein